MGKTIAQQLHGHVEGCGIPGNGRVQYDSDTLIFTFEDESTAKLITTFENCAPFVTGSLSTSTKKPIRIWKVV